MLEENRPRGFFTSKGAGLKCDPALRVLGEDWTTRKICLGTDLDIYLPGRGAPRGGPGGGGLGWPTSAFPVPVSPG